MGQDNDRLLSVGRVVGLFGVRGEVKIESWMDPRERIFDYDAWQLVQKSTKESCVFDKITGRRQGKGLVARLPGVEARDTAATYVGCDIFIQRSQLPRLDEGEYYWVDLEGLDVIGLDGTKLGQVSRLMETGANDVLIVKTESGEHLLPFIIGQAVKQVDIDGGSITVDWEMAC